MRIVERVIRVYMRNGLSGLLVALTRQLSPVRAAMLPVVRSRIVGGRGLEIGGPSQIFSSRGELPIYPLIQRLDNCNFSHVTLWEGELEMGPTFRYDKRRSPGQQHILDASNLATIPDDNYDFILSSHVLEHCANPLKVLQEWARVLTDTGFLLIILPHKEGTFDHRRPVTKLSHILEDYELDVGEDDETHFEGISSLHDLDRDPEAGELESFLARMRRNAFERGVHHHVFDTEAALALVDCADFQIHAVEPMLPFHIICLAQRLPAGSVKDNSAFLGDCATWRKQSPFQADRIGYSV